MIGALASALQLGYALFLVCTGAFGMVFLHWELATFYGLSGAALQGTDGATLLNQFRFLKGIELTFGLFCLFYRRDILAGGLACTICLTGLGLGVLARGSSWIFDGTPHPSFIWYLVIEAVIFCVIWLNARRVLAER